MEQKKAICLSVLGTASDVGKSLIVTGLCRILKNRGIRVAPFKAQNMSNNSFVTKERKEIGRAQVVQAEAAGIKPHTDMNPILLKPNSKIGSQVIVHGVYKQNSTAKDYGLIADELYQKAKESLDRLKNQYEVVILEGAGSCAEVNLKNRDFVNFKIAHHAHASVILVADIDKGGVFAQIIGTLAVSEKRDQNMICGVIVNRFRGDPALFEEGIAYLETKTEKPVFGLIPMLDQLEIDAEDSLYLTNLIDPAAALDSNQINIGVLRFGQISNFTDFSVLARQSGVRLDYLEKPRALHGYHALILPGSKSVRQDLSWLKQFGWDQIINDFVAHGGFIVGICGGFQMLGETIADPCGIEGEKGESQGLGLLGIHTKLEESKTLNQSQGNITSFDEKINGYEIHMGESKRVKNTKPFIKVLSDEANSLHEHFDGAINHNGKVWGTYFHGIFDNFGFTAKFLQKISPHFKPDHHSSSEINQDSFSFKEGQYDLLAKHLEKHLDLDLLAKVTGIEGFSNRPNS